MKTQGKQSTSSVEAKRLEEDLNNGSHWKKWGPYLSERQWGTVREDYSENGDAWNYFTHDQARSRTYKWGEDGLAGISDNHSQLCFSLALWNKKDPILKERLFGLTNSESNHGEDVKEYYFYLDSTPTHSYMKYLYKYPQSAFPYDDLVNTSKGLSRNEFEYELIDTGVFNDNRYFDVFVEYAKASPEDILIKITVHNRGPESAELNILPTLWFRNDWSWGDKVTKPELKLLSENGSTRAINAIHPTLGEMLLYCDGNPSLLFTENETNNVRLFGSPNANPFVKDGINDFVVHDKKEAVNPGNIGTKAVANYSVVVNPGDSQVVRLRLMNVAQKTGKPFENFDNVFKQRKQEADEFYKTIIPSSLNEDQANVMRQALAGMLWSKQYYYYDINKWLNEHGVNPFKRSSKAATRNGEWHHMQNGDIISMPDKWEYPWYAAWDLAFHVLPLTLVDPDFGKQQLKLMLQGNYLHPNGQVPAYEWNFCDVNPPVLAWSTIFTYRLEKLQRNTEDVEWLKSSFQKLLLNFTWWVNRKDRSGRNVFEGGFLGLDNIGVFDRSSPLPTGGYLEQADGTAWMALFSQNMLEIAAELTDKDMSYFDMALKFAEHFLWIASSMTHAGEDTGMWDEEDGFFYDVLRMPNGVAQRLKVRSMVGLLPLCAVTTFDGELMKKYPEFRVKFEKFLDNRSEMFESIHNPMQTGVAGRRLASILNESRLRKVLSKMLDENEFLSPYGLRALSRYHAEHPYSVQVDNQEFKVSYLPGESDTGMFGGNSNWRGPIWMPVNTLVIRALLQYYSFYGDDFKVELPTGSGNHVTLYQVAENLSNRLANIFLKDDKGLRPVYGGTTKFQDDPHWKDFILFYEYFHGDNGAGLGASHQTGWTGVVARLMHLFATASSEKVLALGKKAVFQEA
ncbi:MAG TPA: glucosidase [Cyclobacteriaceae bacterium]|nr:glucosidase [Cyclobacteriaceae bacterium]